MCINFEDVEFTKNKLMCGTGVRSKSHRHSTKTTTPKKVIEKRRSYEWIVDMFNEEVANRACIPKDGFALIKSLKTKLVSNETVDRNDALYECIIEILGEGDEL